MGIFNKSPIEQMFDSSELNRVRKKLEIATKALEDIKDWTDEIMDEYDDPGYRAIAALKQIKEINKQL